MQTSAPYNPGTQLFAPSNSSSMPTLNIFTKPSVHNSTNQTLANAVASYPFFVRPHAPESKIRIRDYQEGTLMFMNTTDAEQQVNSGSMMRNMLSLSDLNKFLQTTYEMTSTDEKSKLRKDYEKTWGRGIGTKLGDIKSGLDVFDKLFKENFAMIGVVRNQIAAADHFGASCHNKQVLLNVDVRGRTRISNVWGNCKQGEFLYLSFELNEGKVGFEARTSKTPLINYEADRQRNIFVGVVSAAPARRQDVRNEALTNQDRCNACSKIDIFFNI
tara:strand:+ start:445 stop:1263 length:819 start_codon:yes stop_codon:yes gene_type:complete